MQKMLVNQAIEAAGIMNTQRLATIFDGISRHAPEGLNFKARVEEGGWKKAVPNAIRTHLIGRPRVKLMTKPRHRSLKKVCG